MFSVTFFTKQEVRNKFYFTAHCINTQEVCLWPVVETNPETLSYLQAFGAPLRCNAILSIIVLAVSQYDVRVLCLMTQERFQVKNPPHTYIQKLRGFLDPAVTRKVRWKMWRVGCFRHG